MLMFPPDWFVAGVVTAESAADFARLAAKGKPRSDSAWRWAALRDFVEERGRLTADECRAVYQLGQCEPDLQLGTAMMCCSLYQSLCPVEVLHDAARSDRHAVQWVATRRLPKLPRP